VVLPKLLRLRGTSPRRATGWNDKPQATTQAGAACTSFFGCSRRSSGASRLREADDGVRKYLVRYEDCGFEALNARDMERRSSSGMLWNRAKRHWRLLRAANRQAAWTGSTTPQSLRARWVVVDPSANDTNARA